MLLLYIRRIRVILTAKVFDSYKIPFNTVPLPHRATYVHAKNTHNYHDMCTSYTS